MGWKDLLPWKWGTKRPEIVEGEQHPVVAVQRDMNRIFDDFHRSFLQMSPFGEMGGSFWGMELPKIDVEETKRRVEVTAEVPGLAEDDLELTLSPAGDVLLLRGERRHASETGEEATGRYRSERYYGVIQRSIALPCAVRMDGAEAKLKNGVLHVKLNKREDSPEAKRITVRPG